MEQIKIQCYVTQAVAVAAGKPLFGMTYWVTREEDLAGLTERQREYMIRKIGTSWTLRMSEYPADWSTVVREIDREIAAEDAAVEKVLAMAPNFWELGYDNCVRLNQVVADVQFAPRVEQALKACVAARDALADEAQAKAAARIAQIEESNRTEREATMKRIEAQRQKEAAEELAAEEIKAAMVQWAKETNETIEHGLAQGYPMTSAMCEAVDAHVATLVQRELPEAIIIDEDQARWADLGWEKRNSPNQASFEALAKFERVLKQVQVDLPFLGDVSSTAFVVRCTEEERYFTALVAEYVLPLSSKRRVILVDLE